MPRGRKSKKVEEVVNTSKTSFDEPRKISKENILESAKALGLFKKNKYNGTYEIVVSINEYDRI